jgi:hypothetical protein
MTIQASGRSAVLAAALIAASAFGFAGTGASYAATDGAPQIAAEAPADATPAAPAATDSNAAAEQQAAPAFPFPTVGHTVADNRDTTVAATSDATATLAASADDSSGWDKASIIGKIFIACGTLLTLGSAARMFMI